MATLAVAGHLSAAELGRRYRAARGRVERGHLQVVWLLRRGRNAAEVARVMGLSGLWVAEIVRRYNEKGPEAGSIAKRESPTFPGDCTSEVPFGPELPPPRPRRAPHPLPPRRGP